MNSSFLVNTWKHIHIDSMKPQDVKWYVICGTFHGRLLPRCKLRYVSSHKVVPLVAPQVARICSFPIGKQSTNGWFLIAMLPKGT